MKHKIGDMWNMDYDAICVPTNGVVGKSGLIMGAGVALQAKKYFPKLPKTLGKLVKEHGNVPYHIAEYRIISFPTKHHYNYPSDIDLIENSARLVAKIADTMSLENIVMPEVGCGLGSLEWNDVKKVIGKILDDRFTVISKRKK